MPRRTWRRWRRRRGKRCDAHLLSPYPSHPSLTLALALTLALRRVLALTLSLTLALALAALTLGLAPPSAGSGMIECYWLKAMEEARQVQTLLDITRRLVPRRLFLAAFRGPCRRRTARGYIDSEGGIGKTLG